MDWVRRATAGTLEFLYDLSLWIGKGTSEDLSTDEVELGRTLRHVEASRIPNGTRHASGFAKNLLAIGGPTYRVPGTIKVVAEGDLFTPAPWWRERGLVAEVVRSLPGRPTRG